VCAFDGADRFVPGGVEQAGRHEQHAQVDDPGQPETDEHVQPGGPQERPPPVDVTRRHAPLGQRRVQVDDVRHHGGADDAGGQHDAVGAVESGEEAVDRLACGRAGHRQVVEESEEDDGEQRDDRQLEAAVPALLQGEDHERDDGGQQARGNSGTPNSRFSPTAAPTNSARSVAMAISSACTQSPTDAAPEKCSRHSSGSPCP
jgi:hypothetical protein